VLKACFLCTFVCLPCSIELLRVTQIGFVILVLLDLASFGLVLLRFIAFMVLDFETV
jgi:hypothetical protein